MLQIPHSTQAYFGPNNIIRFFILDSDILCRFFSDLDTSRENIVVCCHDDVSDNPFTHLPNVTGQGQKAIFLTQMSTISR